MHNFHFPKIIASVSPLLAKETILSKIVSMVDVFKMSMSQGFDDNNKKYIETVTKLDHSKTIMLETKGKDLRVKNIIPVKVKKNQRISVDYSEYAQETEQKVCIDYPYMNEIPIGTEIICKHSDVILQVQLHKTNDIVCKVLQSGIIYPYDSIEFRDYTPHTCFLSEKDKKDIQWGLMQGVHIISAANVQTADDVQQLKVLLHMYQNPTVRVFAKIETPQAIKNFDSIVDIADGIILCIDDIHTYIKKSQNTIPHLIATCKAKAQPVYVHYTYNVRKSTYPLLQGDVLISYCKQGVDGFLIETMIDEEDPYRICSIMSELLSDAGKYGKKDIIDEFYKHSDYIIRDYIIHNAYKITKDLDIKAIVCFTENGYTPARLSSLHPSIPIIAFTSVDTTYRYINMLWGVKGYKVTPHFDYQNLKRIGKEMLKSLFKGSIALDDKIVIVQAKELTKDEKTDMINGIELYEFKNI